MHLQGEKLTVVFHNFVHDAKEHHSEDSVKVNNRGISCGRAGLCIHCTLVRPRKFCFRPTATDCFFSLPMDLDWRLANNLIGLYATMFVSVQGFTIGIPGRAVVSTSARQWDVEN